MRAPTTNSDLPWDKIRLEWEHGEISLRVLAAKYAMTSVTTLVRKRQAEGWVRNTNKPAVRAALSERVSEASKSDDTSTALPDGPCLACAARMVKERHTRQDQGPADADAVLTPSDAASDDVLDAERLLQPMTLAQIQASSVSRQVALALEVEKTGFLLLRRLQAVLQPPTGILEGEDPGDDEGLAHVQRLIRINPDRDTLTGLIAAATKTIDVGVAIERRALAGLAPPMAAADAVPEDAAGKATMAMLARLDSHTADKLREWAVNVQQEKRAAQIAAARGQRNS